MPRCIRKEINLSENPEAEFTTELRYGLREKPREFRETERSRKHT